MHATAKCHMANQFLELIQADLNTTQGFRPPRNNPYSNTYNPGWRNHPNFPWKQGDASNLGNTRPLPPQPIYQPSYENPPQNKPSEMDELKAMMKAMQEHQNMVIQSQNKMITDMQSQIGILLRQLGNVVRGSCLALLRRTLRARGLYLASTPMQ